MGARGTIGAGLLLASAWACTEDAPPALILRLTSDLEIPTETNSLAVRVTGSGDMPIEQTYVLGTPPRDIWPQSVPILAGQSRPERILVVAELRVAEEGRPSVVVGFQMSELPFPASGETEAELQIPRACMDEDEDGFGVGFGCEFPDCDDTRADVPDPNFCGSEPPVDGGPQDAGVTGRPDAGGRDAGLPLLCDNSACDADEQCFIDQCLQRCERNSDCPDVNLGCLVQFGVCICRVPCMGNDQCGPFECVDGCCEI